MRPHLLWFGMVQALGSIAVLAAIGAFVGRDMAYPPPELLYSIASAGVAILLGYVVEAVWMVNRAERKEWHESWLGFVCGVGLAGLMGIATALLVAAHREAHHGSLADDFGLWWSVASLGCLGILVTLHPLVVDRWIKKEL
jgi:hypothetical protein